MRLTRRERIRLLLATYSDAAGPSRSLTDVPAVPSSKPPPVSELWSEGSYHELTVALERLRSPCPKIHRHVRGVYITKEPWARRSTAEKGVGVLMGLMPPNVYVPQEIAENAGFPPAEAKAAARPVRLAA